MGPAEIARGIIRNGSAGVAAGHKQVKYMSERIIDKPKDGTVEHRLRQFAVLCNKESLTRWTGEGSIFLLFMLINLLFMLINGRSCGMKTVFGQSLSHLGLMINTQQISPMPIGIFDVPFT
jgi:hypothetical protein